MEMPNRKQRRLIAKSAGYLKKKGKASLSDSLEISKRAAEVGKQIHLANVERNLRANDLDLQNKEQQKIASLIESGVTPEEALKIIQSENNTDV